MNQANAFHTARDLYLHTMILKVFGAKSEREVALVNDSPMGESLDEIRPDDWVRYSEVQLVRGRIKAGLDFTDFLVTIDTDVEPEATFDIYGEAA
jgi:hypothetical protein